MKKAYIFLLCAALMLSLAACGAEKPEPTAATTATVEPASEPSAAPEAPTEPENAKLREIVPELDGVDTAFCLVSQICGSAEQAGQYDVPDDRVPELMKVIRAVDLDGCEYFGPDTGAVTKELLRSYSNDIVINLADASEAADGWSMYIVLADENGVMDVVVAETDANGEPTAYHLFKAPDQAALLALSGYIFINAETD